MQSPVGLVTYLAVVHTGKGGTVPTNYGGSRQGDSGEGGTLQVLAYRGPKGPTPSETG